MVRLTLRTWGAIKAVTPAVGPWRSWERASMASRRSWVRIPSAPLTSRFYNVTANILARPNARFGRIRQRHSHQLISQFDIDKNVSFRVEVCSDCAHERGVKGRQGQREVNGGSFSANSAARRER